MKIGDYIRTRDGDIGKFFEKYKGIQGAIIYKIDRPTEDFDYTNVFDFEIIKTSPRIIDLIQVGDYVNNSKVVDIAYAPKKAIYVEQSRNGALLPILNDRINSVLTKEQFEAMKYKVGD